MAFVVIEESEMDYGPDHYSNKPVIAFGDAEDNYTHRKYLYSVYDNTQRYKDPEVRSFKITCPYCGYHRAMGGRINNGMYVSAICGRCNSEYPI